MTPLLGHRQLCGIFVHSRDSVPLKEVISLPPEHLHAEMTIYSRKNTVPLSQDECALVKITHSGTDGDASGLFRFFTVTLIAAIGYLLSAGAGSRRQD